MFDAGGSRPAPSPGLGSLCRFLGPRPRAPRSPSARRSPLAWDGAAPAPVPAPGARASPGVAVRAAASQSPQSPRRRSSRQPAAAGGRPGPPPRAPPRTRPRPAPGPAPHAAGGQARSSPPSRPFSRASLRPSRHPRPLPRRVARRRHNGPGAGSSSPAADAFAKIALGSRNPRPDPSPARPGRSGGRRSLSEAVGPEVPALGARRGGAGQGDWESAALGSEGGKVGASNPQKGRDWTGLASVSRQPALWIQRRVPTHPRAAAVAGPGPCP